MGQDMTVFVIEDTDKAGESAASVISAEGLQVQAFSCCRDFLHSGHTERQGCVVADSKVRGWGGLDLLDELAGKGLWMPVIIVMRSGDVEVAVDAMKRGAVDVIARPFERHALICKVQAALQLDRDYRASRLAASSLRCRIDRLTPREREVLDLVVGGLSSKSIARRLGIGHRTVEVHRAHLMEKLQARTSAELIRMVLSAGLPIPSCGEARSSARPSGGFWPAHALVPAD